MHTLAAVCHTHIVISLLHFRPTNSNNAAGRPPFCRACISFCLIRLPRSPRKLRACACVCLWKPMQPQYTDGVCAMRQCNAMLSVCSFHARTRTVLQNRPWAFAPCTIYAQNAPLRVRNRHRHAKLSLQHASTTACTRSPNRNVDMSRVEFTHMHQWAFCASRSSACMRCSMLQDTSTECGVIVASLLTSGGYTNCNAYCAGSGLVCSRRHSTSSCIG